MTTGADGWARSGFGSMGMIPFDELLDPREIRNHLLHALGRALRRRRAPAEPVARIGIQP